MIGWLPNASVTGETLAAGAVALPLRATVRAGFTGSLLVMIIEAFRIPEAVGVKITLRVQLAPAARLVPQVLVWVKSPELLPFIVIPVIARGAVPLLDRVAVCGVLEVLIGWPGNDKAEGERAATCPTRDGVARSKRAVSSIPANTR